jgi:hypothetical protein
MLSGYYQCTCGFEFEFESDAVMHVAACHVKEEAQEFERYLKDRVRVMISSPFKPFSFDEKLYAAKG